MTTNLGDIRRRIKKQRGIEFKKLSRKPASAVSLKSFPSTYKKSNLMKLTELRLGKPLDKIIFTGTIYELEKELGVDASTISKWRKLINEALDREFMNKFKEDTNET